MTWQSSLLYRQTKNGQALKAIPANASTILSHHESWVGVLAYSEFVEAEVKLKAPPWDDVDAPASNRVGEWSDADTARAAHWLSRHFEIDLGTRSVEQAVVVAAARVVVHPVRDWLRSLKWDGTKRLDRLFVDYLGAPDTTYARGVGARFAISAVARVFSPGAKVDNVTVLEGEQGIGKSTFVRVLAGDEHFADTPIVMGEKDSYQALRGKWLIELGELHSLSRSDLNRAKNFISATFDTYRPSYGRRTRDFPRQCVFVGTTNALEYLRDETGNRRFWPVRCTQLDLDRLRADRDQLWAEARVRYERGERWHVDDDFAAECSDEQEERFVEDPWHDIVEAWVYAKDQQPRRTQGVTTTEVLQGALKLGAGQLTKPDQERIAAILRRLGWSRGKQKREGGERVRRFLPPVRGVVTPAVTDPVTDATSRKDETAPTSSPPSPVDLRAGIGDQDPGVTRKGSQGDSSDTGDAVTPGCFDDLLAEGYQ